MSKSARMRDLFATGRTVSEVAALVGVDYAFAYGVAKRAGFVGRLAGASRGPRGATGARFVAARRLAPIDAPGEWKSVDIRANLGRYLAERGPTLRYASFDYCFNYFQSTYEMGQIKELLRSPERQIACLQLGFYLASWGMYRGSTVLLQRSVAHLAPVIDVIANVDRDAWAMDADRYTPSHCERLLEIGSQIRSALGSGVTDTLVTKIMLGVFGSVPAFDANFRTGFGVSTFGRASLMRVGRFYEDHADVIDEHRVLTLSFDSGVESKRRYTRAKVIDMIFFVEGAEAAKGGRAG